MSELWADDIYEFHKYVVEIESKRWPAKPSEDRRRLRYKLIFEESNETLEAIAFNEDVDKIVDGCIDTIVVAIGTMLEYGLNPYQIQQCWDEIHRTNMAKQGGPIREDGKRLKPEGWTPPDIKTMISGWQIDRVKKPIPAIYACQCEEAGMAEDEHIAGCIESPIPSRADPEAYSGEPRKCAYCSQSVGSWEDLRQHIKTGGCFEPIPDPPGDPKPFYDGESDYHRFVKEIFALAEESTEEE